MYRLCIELMEITHHSTYKNNFSVKRKKKVRSKGWIWLGINQIKDPGSDNSDWK